MPRKRGLVTIDLPTKVEEQFQCAAWERIEDYWRAAHLYDYNLRDLMIAAYRQGLMDAVQIAPRLEEMSNQR